MKWRHDPYPRKPQSDGETTWEDALVSGKQRGLLGANPPSLSSCISPAPSSLFQPPGPLFAFSPLTQFLVYRVSWAIELTPQGAGIFHTMERRKTQVRHSPTKACFKH